MSNPIRVIREDLGLNVGDFSVAVGVSRDWIRMIENGQAGSITPRLKEALGEMGYNGDQIAIDYKNWRLNRKVELRNQVREQ